MANDVSIRIKVDASTDTLTELNKKLVETKEEAKRLGKETELNIHFDSKEVVVAKSELAELTTKATAVGSALNLKFKLDKDGNVKMLSDDLEQLRSKAKEAADGTQVFNASLKNMAVTAAGLVGVHAIFEGIGDGIKKAVNAAAEFETFETTLKTLTGSSAEAKKSMAWIEEFAAKTPYSLQETTAAFVKLKAYGIDPIKGDILKTLGDTASAMGKDINQAVEAIADATTGEFERLKEFGIKASVEGEKVTLKWATASGEQRQIIVDNNAAIIQDTLAAIMNSKYKDAMEERSKTFVGAASNMGDAFTKFLKTAAEESGIFDAYKDAMKAIGDKLSKITREDIREFIDKIKTAAKEVGFFVGAFSLLKIISLLSKISTTIGTMLSTIRLATIAQTAFNTAAKANPYALVLGVVASIASSFGLFGSKAEEAGDKAKAAMDKTAKETEELEKKQKAAAVGMTQTEGEAAAKIAASAKELKDKLKGYSEERQASHEKTISSLKTKELELKDAIVKTQTELKEKLERLEADRVNRTRDIRAMAIEVDRKNMNDLQLYQSKLDQMDEARRLAKIALSKGDFETYKKYSEMALSIARETGNTEIKVNGEVRVTKEETARIAKAAIKDVSDMENKYFAAKKAQEIAIYNQKIDLLKAELAATIAKIQAEMAQLAILAKIYAALTGKSIDISINTAQGQAALAALDAQYKALDGQKIQVDADASKAKSEITKTGDEAKKAATIPLEVNSEKARKDLKELKEKEIAESIKIEIDGETKDVENDITNLKRPTTSIHTIDGKIANQAVIDALKKDTSSTHTVYVKTVQTRQNGGEIFDIAGARGLQRGGSLPGYGGGDTVPAMLEPGEFVVKKEAVARYGQSFLNDLNTMNVRPQVRKYATGGLVLSEADNSFVKSINNDSYSQSSSSSTPIADLIKEIKELKLINANPPFSLGALGADSFISKLEELKKALESLSAQQNTTPETIRTPEQYAKDEEKKKDISAQITQKQADAEATKADYDTKSSEFRSKVKQEVQQYKGRLRADVGGIGTRIAVTKMISPDATGEDDEIRSSIEDAKESYQEAIDAAKAIVMKMVEPFQQYGAIGPNLDGMDDLGVLSRKAIEVKKKVLSVGHGANLTTPENFNTRVTDLTQSALYQYRRNGTIPSSMRNDGGLTFEGYAKQIATRELDAWKRSLRFQVGGAVPNLAAGAKLSGYGGGDILPAYLEPGEFVVRKEAVSHFGSDMLHAINNISIPAPSVMKFQTGGVVPGISNKTAISNREVTINIKGERGESMKMISDDATAKALESYLRRRA